MNYQRIEKPIFTVKKDDKGREYMTAYSNVWDSSCVVSYKEKNTILKGNPKINYRKGESVFGEELIFEFLIDPNITPVKTKQNTTHNNIEIYLPMEQGLDFLNNALQFFRTGVKPL